VQAGCGEAKKKAYESGEIRWWLREPRPCRNRGTSRELEGVEDKENRKAAGASTCRVLIEVFIDCRRQIENREDPHS